MILTPVRLGAAVLVAAVGVTLAGPAVAGSGYHPHAPKRTRIKTIDMSGPALRARAMAERAAAEATADPPDRSWEQLERMKSETDPDVPTGPNPNAGLPDGWVQRGSVVLPAEVANGDKVVDPDVIYAVEDIPGNKYPRKHTLYLNFVGADLLSGADNSALDKSTLARQGPYPGYTGGDQKATAIAQAVAEDVSPYGIRVVYLPSDRPSKTLPYTMEMVGGNWTDTNIDSPAGGVAPGADCGALGQRHVVYTFAGGGMGVNTAANTASQEAGHAWGLDHTNNCGSVMSYCGAGNGSFSDTCDTFCTSQCQGPASITCTKTHEMFCGEDSDQQNDAAELSWIFGTNEPDVEPPTVQIQSPEDGAVLESGADVDLRAVVDDDYGGFGWRNIITHNGETVLDEPAYDKGSLIDDEYRAALNLTNLEDGMWTITVEVEDHADHVTAQTVSFQVGDTVMMGEDETGVVPGTTTQGGAESGSDSTDDGTSAGSGGVIPRAPEGCACQAGRRSDPPPLFALMPLLLLGAARRRACATGKVR